MSPPNEALLEEHLAAENAHDLDRIMATYTASPVIELNGARIEGREAVCEFHRRFGFGGAEGSFSNVHVTERRRHRTSDAVIIEQTLSGAIMDKIDGSATAQPRHSFSFVNKESSTTRPRSRPGRRVGPRKAGRTTVKVLPWHEAAHDRQPSALTAR